MLDRRILYVIDDVVAHQECRVFLSAPRILSRRHTDVRLHAHVCQVILKIFELCIYSFIALTFLGVDIVQLAQYNVKRLCQRIEVYYLFPVLPAALDSEIRVYQQQRLHGKILELKVPRRMIARDVRDHRHVFFSQELIRIVIMEIRYPPGFLRAASELAYVMTCSSARQQRHVHRYVCPRELFAHESRHMVHASDVPHRIERSYLAAYPHEFEYIAPGPEFLQSFIFLEGHAISDFVIIKEFYLIRRRKPFDLSLISQKRAVVFHKEIFRAFLPFVCRDSVIFGIHQRFRLFAYESQPAALRLSRPRIHHRLQRTEYRPRRKITVLRKLFKCLFPLKIIQQLRHASSAHAQYFQRAFARQELLRLLYQISYQTISPVDL